MSFINITYEMGTEAWLFHEEGKKIYITSCQQDAILFIKKKLCLHLPIYLFQVSAGFFPEEREREKKKHHMDYIGIFPTAIILICEELYLNFLLGLLTNAGCD